jgi:cell division protein FtsL
LALGALGAAVASIVAGFMALTWWKMPLAVLGIVLLISGPAMLIAYLKLRKRNLAPILDANGWAINAKATVNISFGNLLTQTASLPLNSRVNLIDPFKKKGTPIWKIVVGALLIAGAALYALVRFGILSLW